VTAVTSSALATGGHICVVIEDDQHYGDLAADYLLEGSAAGEKTVVFGPSGSVLRERLAPLADIVADPYADFLGSGRLDPPGMFAMFRDQAATALSEGFTRLRVAADMDWLLPASPTADEVLAFEVLLDPVVAELDAKVLCAYRPVSFAADTILGMACTHPTVIHDDEEPPFKLVAAGEGRWVLAGELDFAGASILTSALRATAATPWVLDVENLTFTDVAGMRAIATTAAELGPTLELHHGSPSLRRLWRIAGLEHPRLRFVDRHN
jgi:anti-anti-sigma regulatory factor